MLESMGSKQDNSVIQLVDLAELRRKINEALDSKNPAAALAKLTHNTLTHAEGTALSKAYTAAGKDITGYRRVIHPEVSKAGNTCGLCIAASQRFYHIPNLDPIHDNCNCTVVPIVGSQDPGLNLNESDMKRLYAAAGKKTTPKALSAVRFAPTSRGLGKQQKRNGDEKTTTQQTA